MVTYFIGENMDVKLKQIDKAIWMMEQHDTMKVPAYIFANDKLIGKMQKDRTLQQLKNVASLEGIINHASVMPDGHEGYGFPIGGVAAFDAEDGLVSPGGVGYDINCLPAGTKILTALGYSKPIESFESSFSFTVQTNGTVLMMGKSALSTGKEIKNAIHFMHKNYEGGIYSISTFSGSVRVTKDHPVITPEGKRLSSELTEGDTCLIYPFEGVEYEYFCEKENELAIYAKLLGYLTGDGTLTRSGNKIRAIFFGKKGDLEGIKKEITTLGFHSHLTERTRNHEINGKKFIATNCELHVYSKQFTEKLIELGAALGNKTKVSFRVPEWIRHAPVWIKRLYLAGFFGAELSSPSTSSKTGFYMPNVSMNKLASLENDARIFLLDISEMLKEAGIEVYKIAFVERIKNKVRLRLEIASDEENLEKLYSKIGYEYNEKRSIAGMSAVIYIRMKRAYRNKREEIRAKITELKSKGFHLRELQEKFSGRWANARFIERAYYGGRNARAPLSIPSFDEFYKNQLEIYEKFGALSDEIVQISKKSFSGKVYDFEVEDIHRFIADGIVVSNCGVRLLTTELTEAQVRPKIREVCDALFKNVPSGVGSEGRLKISHEELDVAVVEGIDWALEKGYGRKEDKERTEEYGRMAGADPTAVTPTAKKRGKTQFGTLGAGNHFLEIQVVDKIMNPEAAKAFGLYEGQITVMIHCGSRGYGHQVCTDSIPPLLDLARRSNLWLPDPELVYAPIKTPEAQRYMDSMRCAVNYAFVNRHIIAHWTRETFDQVFGKGTSEPMKLVYDVAHNIAKYEEHTVDNKRRKLIVHRKGATRAFPAGREELPPLYRSIGQPVLIPGSMGTSSYVLVGRPKGLDVSWGSTCHGAGRAMSRGDAIRSHDGRALTKELWEKNQIYIRATEPKVVAEEAPDAYKNVDDVVESVALAGISDIVAKLRPIGVVKG